MYFTKKNITYQAFLVFFSLSSTMFTLDLHFFFVFYKYFINMCVCVCCIGFCAFVFFVWHGPLQKRFLSCHHNLELILDLLILQSLQTKALAVGKLRNSSLLVEDWIVLLRLAMKFPWKNIMKHKIVRGIRPNMLQPVWLNILGPVQDFPQVHGQTRISSLRDIQNRPMFQHNLLLLQEYQFVFVLPLLSLQ